MHQCLSCEVETVEWSDWVDLPSLQTVSLGFQAFLEASSISFISECLPFISLPDLPSLTDLLLHDSSLRGLEDETVLLSGANKKSLCCSLTMTDLPSLRHLHGKGSMQFAACSVVTLKSVHRLIDWWADVCEDVEIDLSASFGNVHTLHAESEGYESTWRIDASTLEQFIRSTSYHFSHASYYDSLSSSLVDIACDAQLTNCNTITSIDLFQFPNLQSFTCPSFSFPNVSSFKCENHSSIQSIQIGKSSLCGKEGEFIITNCPALNEVVIGSKSCVMYISFRLESGEMGSEWLIECDQLKTLLFGREKELSQCFYACHVLRVESENTVRRWWIDLASLERVEIGAECFNECNKVSFSSFVSLLCLVSRPPSSHFTDTWILCLWWRIVRLRLQGWFGWNQQEQWIRDGRWNTAVLMMNRPSSIASVENE